MSAAVGLMAETTFAPRDRGGDEALASFYRTVFGRTAVDASSCVAVDDIEVTLARVWDLGGTIVSTPERDGATVRAAFRDLRGNLVLVAAEWRSIA